MKKPFGVKIWEEAIELPTYEVGIPDENPMFLEKRVYQGSSGKVYPLPVTDKIFDKKVLKKYKVVFLENEYLKIMVMPELGGRIHRAIDKTNNYDFVYYNEVIKPALVGLTGPWISGGIEFNWPQHHRPNTFGPVEYQICEYEDGSKTLWVSEIDRMYGTKGMAGFTLYPDKAYLEIKGQLYNGTELPQTFLWWANPAVAVNDHTQSIFPPDVHAVFDHGKRDVSKFPIATGVYYKMDYSEGVDISRYKNIPVPTSYMAYKSDFDFVGGYDFSREAGILHIANHLISPGKKQWTWGNGDFGKAWDRNLTDENGPYIELMTGVFTDNQPDFTWLKPYEEKTFKQYFMPYKEVGAVKNANIHGAIGVECIDDCLEIVVYVTEPHAQLEIEVTQDKSQIWFDKIGLSPERAYKKILDYKVKPDLNGIQICVRNSSGQSLIEFYSESKELEKIPDAAKPLETCDKIKTVEELYLAGQHLEQYRHATFEPDGYYLEGLKRDPGDIRINNAYGLLRLRRGEFEQSNEHFLKAIDRSTLLNPNPYNSEPYYNYGISLTYQGKLSEAYKMFYKATWSHECQSQAFYEIAAIDLSRGDYDLALAHIEKSLQKNCNHMKARHIKSIAMRKKKQIDLALAYNKATLEIDPLDLGAMVEIALLEGNAFERLQQIVGCNVHNYLNLARDLAKFGELKEAIQILELSLEIQKYPLSGYYIAYYQHRLGMPQWKETMALAENADSKYCFPNDITDIAVLDFAISQMPHGSMAHYYLGNLLYDRKRYKEAISLWEKAALKFKEFPIVHRNLALAYYNKQGNAKKALEFLEQAVEMKPEDARLLLELDQLKKKMNFEPVKRLEMLENRIDVVEKRDDLYVEYLTLLNMVGQPEEVLSLIGKRKFHPWEGGEGKITKQFIAANVSLAQKALDENVPELAIIHLSNTMTYPENLGEGKLYGAQENDINYYFGCAYHLLGDVNMAKTYWEMASVGLDEPVSAMFYNDQPPEMIFYQGLAHIKLGNPSKAMSKFNKLISYGELHIHDDVKIDYFAISLPDFLIFEDDLNLRNLVHCHYLIGLGLIGKGLLNEMKFDSARKSLEKALTYDNSHQGVISHLDFLGNISKL